MSQNEPQGVRPGASVGIAGAVALIIGAVFAVEGGYVHHRNDPGGATNHGITEQVARKHGYTGRMQDLKRTCTVAGEVCAESIYRKDYIEKPGFLPLVAIDPVVAEEVIDTAVNMGPPRPSRWFQLSLNQTCGTSLAIDGRIGPQTVGAWRDCRANLGPRACVAMVGLLDRFQEAEYDRLVRVNPRLRVFRKGWQNNRIGNVDTRRCGA